MAASEAPLLSYSGAGSSPARSRSCSRLFSGDEVEREDWAEEATLGRAHDEAWPRIFIFARPGRQAVPTWRAPDEYQPFIPKESMFARWVEQWREERGAASSLSDMFACPSYLKIIGIGERALPLIFARLRSERDDPDHWFAALEAITGENPIPENDCGDTLKMAEAWLSWAEKKSAR